MSGTDMGHVASAFARATTLMDEARDRLEALSLAEVAAQSVLSEARRVNGGLLQVLSVLHSAAEHAVANQESLQVLTARVDAKLGGTWDAAEPEFADRLADVVVERVVATALDSADQGQSALAEVLDLLRTPPTPAWLPTMQHFVAGVSTSAAERAVAPVAAGLDELVGLAEAVRMIEPRLEDLDDRVHGIGLLVFEQVRAAVFDQMPAAEPNDALLVRLDDIECAVRALGAKREALPRAVSEGISSLLVKIEALEASNAALVTSLTRMSAKQSALDKRLAQIDGTLMDLAKDGDDVHAAAYEPDELGSRPTEAATRSGGDILPQRTRRRLFGS